MPQHTPIEQAKNNPTTAPQIAARQVPVEGNTTLPGAAQGEEAAQLQVPGNEAEAQAQVMEGLRNITLGNEVEGAAMIQQGFALLAPETAAAFLEGLPPEQAAIVTAQTTQEQPIEEFLFGAA